MLTKIENFLKDIENQKIRNKADLDNFKSKYLSKKGLINSLFSDFKNIPNNQKLLSKSQIQ